jgi:hypothetical protein
MSLAQLTKKLGSDKPWLELEPAATQTGGLDGVDPNQSLDQLMTLQDVHELGADVVDGEEMTQYSAVLDPGPMQHVFDGRAREHHPAAAADVYDGTGVFLRRGPAV